MFFFIYIHIYIQRKRKYPPSFFPFPPSTLFIIPGWVGLFHFSLLYLPRQRKEDRKNESARFRFLLVFSPDGLHSAADLDSSLGEAGRAERTELVAARNTPVAARLRPHAHGRTRTDAHAHNAKQAAARVCTSPPPYTHSIQKKEEKGKNYELKNTRQQPN